MGTRTPARHARHARRRKRNRTVAIVASIVAVLAVGGTAGAAAFVLPTLPASFPFAAEPSTSASPAHTEDPSPTAEPPAPEPTAEPVATTEPEPPAPEPEPAPPAPPSPLAQPCDTTTLMSVWAHQDDDLIFANPTIQDAMNSGECVRTFYLTAGDAGKGPGYSRSRELGILRSYNVMRGGKAFWDESSITMNSGAHVTVFARQGDPRISVAFLRLPDGGLDASGFAATGRSSIPQLLAGQIGSISPIDGGPALTAPALQQTVNEAIGAWAPGRLLTHVPAASPLSQGDHPDHGATGSLVRAAVQALGYPVDAVRYYVGYPSQNLPANVSGDMLARKIDAYRIYAKEDPVIACVDNAACLARKGFGAWLQRSYAKTDGELGIG